jgi:hypothetical protein
MVMPSKSRAMSTHVSEQFAPAPRADRIIELANAFRGAKTLLCAVELGVFTVLSGAALDLATLTDRLKIAERGARDFFDALVALGMLERDSTGRYRNTPQADHYLDACKPTYIGEELNHLNVRGYRHWNSLTAALKTGQRQSEGGADAYFDALFNDEQLRETFAKGMTGASRLAAPAVIAKFPWRQYRTMIDVGTAEGGLPVEIVRAHPHIRGGGFDLPVMQAGFERYVRKQACQDNLRFYPGDFLRDALPSADVLVFGRVLHNWDLPTKKMLLRKAYSALPKGGAIIVYERLIDDERRANSAARLASLNMLIMTSGGFDFSSADCAGWMREVGFRGPRFDTLTCDLSMIVGEK